MKHQTQSMSMNLLTYALRMDNFSQKQTNLLITVRLTFITLTSDCSCSTHERKDFHSHNNEMYIKKRSYCVCRASQVYQKMTTIN